MQTSQSVIQNIIITPNETTDQRISVTEQSGITRRILRYHWYNVMVYMQHNLNDVDVDYQCYTNLVHPPQIKFLSCHISQVPQCKVGLPSGYTLVRFI